MYAPFFGLSQEPFSIAPDPRYLYMSERHREALAHLLYGLGGGGGFVLLTGEIGAGKTTVCRCFLEQVPPRCNVAYIFNPKLSVPELLRTVCDEFRIPHKPAAGGEESVKDYVDALNEFLLRTHAVGQNNVLIIDEAQNLSADVLEQLRLLTNLETNERKLLQIILIGQPELRQMLARPELEQLAQRVIARFHLEALSEDETAAYIQHRLAVAGLTGALPFDRAQVRRIHRLTRGVPRRINLLCDRALLGAYAGGRPRVSGAIIEQAAKEVFGDPRGAARASSPGPSWQGVGLAMAGAVLVGAVAWSLQAGTGRPGARGPAVAASAAAGPLAAASAASSTLPGGPAASAAWAGKAAAGASGTPASGPSTAATGSAAASSAAGSAAAGLVPLLQALPGLPRSEVEAWQLLAARWDLPAGEAHPCDIAARAQVRCDRQATSLAQVRQLARPGILTLRDPAGGSAYAVLTGLGSREATVLVGGTEQRVPLDELASLWRGEFSTLWRLPPGYDPARADSPGGAAGRWLAEKLPRPPAAAGSAAAAGLKSRIYAFQAAQGLPPDGVPGPLTLMQLNRVAGVDEPHLTLEP